MHHIYGYEYYAQLSYIASAGYQNPYVLLVMQLLLIATEKHSIVMRTELYLNDSWSVSFTYYTTLLLSILFIHINIHTYILMASLDIYVPYVSLICTSQRIYYF